VTFALTGSVTAAQSGLDVFGCAMVGMVTAVGGGTIRDAVFLSKRPFWTSETEYVWMTVLTGVATFFLWPHVLEWQSERQKIKQLKQQRKDEEQYGENLIMATTTAIGAKERSVIGNDDAIGLDSSDDEKQYDELDAALDTFDAIGLAAFAIVGAQNGVRAGVPMAVSAICGMSTSTFGGLTRDVLCGRPVRIVHSNAEQYATTALAGAVTYLVAKTMNAVPWVRIGSAFAVCMGSRYVAVKHDVKLHTWDTENDGRGVAVRK